jgi:hypothetical protein
MITSVLKCSCGEMLWAKILGSDPSIDLALGNSPQTVTFEIEPCEICQQKAQEAGYNLARNDELAPILIDALERLVKSNGFDQVQHAEKVLTAVKGLPDA